MTIQIIITLINANSRVTTQTIRNKSSLVNEVLQNGSGGTPPACRGPWVVNLCQTTEDYVTPDRAELLIPSGR